MPIKSESRVIDGVKYTVRLMPTSVNMNLFKQLQKIILPIFAAYNEYENMNAPTWVSEATAAYLIQMDSTDLVQVCKTLLYETYINYDGDHTSTRSGSGKMVFDSKDYDNDYSFDVHFSGKLDVLAELLAFAIEINYPTFFSQASFLIATFKESMKNSQGRGAELIHSESELASTTEETQKVEK